MEFRKFTEPFSGTEFDALEFDDGSLLFDTAFIGESCSVAYNKELDAYMLPASVFRHRATVSLSEAAEILGVSRMRISKLCSKNQLKHTKVNGIISIDWESIDEYNNINDNDDSKGSIND